jgi:hypothetical protein
MPRTTVDIDASVLRELKRRQERERKTLGQLMSELLAKALESEEDTTAPPRFGWVTKDLQPRIDLDDKDALWAALDER